MKPVNDTLEAIRNLDALAQRIGYRPNGARPISALMLDESATIELIRQEVELRALRFAQQITVGRLATERINPSSLAGDVGCRLSVEVYGRESTREVSYPATWWDAFKLRFFPPWALKRWPPQSTTVIVKARALLPEVWPLERRHVVIYAVE